MCCVFPCVYLLHCCFMIVWTNKQTFASCFASSGYANIIRVMGGVCRKEKNAICRSAGVTKLCKYQRSGEENMPRKLSIFKALTVIFRPWLDQGLDHFYQRSIATIYWAILGYMCLCTSEPLVRTHFLLIGTHIHDTGCPINN